MPRKKQITEPEREPEVPIRSETACSTAPITGQKADVEPSKKADCLLRSDTACSTDPMTGQTADVEPSKKADEPIRSETACSADPMTGQMGNSEPSKKADCLLRSETECSTDPLIGQMGNVEPRKNGSGSIRAAVLRIGALPVSQERADAVRAQLGLEPDSGITHYDSLAAAGWAKAEDTASKDWALFLRDTGGENPSQLAKGAGGTASAAAGAVGPLPDLDPDTLRQEDLQQYSDETLRALLAMLDSVSGDGSE